MQKFKIWSFCAGERIECFVMGGVLNFIGTSDVKYIPDSLLIMHLSCDQIHFLCC